MIKCTCDVARALARTMIGVPFRKFYASGYLVVNSQVSNTYVAFISIRILYLQFNIKKFNRI